MLGQTIALDVPHLDPTLIHTDPPVWSHQGGVLPLNPLQHTVSEGGAAYRTICDEKHIFCSRTQLFSEANSLTLGHVWSQLKIFKRQFLDFFNSKNSSSCQQRGGIYKRCYFCLSQHPKIKKESTANTFVIQMSRGGHKEPAELTVVEKYCQKLWTNLVDHIWEIQ